MATRSSVRPIALPPTSASTLSRISGSRNVVPRRVHNLLMRIGVPPSYPVHTAAVERTNTLPSVRLHTRAGLERRKSLAAVTPQATRNGRLRADTCTEGGAKGEGRSAEDGVMKKGGLLRTPAARLTVHRPG